PCRPLRADAQSGICRGWNRLPARWLSFRTTPSQVRRPRSPGCCDSFHSRPGANRLHAEARGRRSRRRSERLPVQPDRVQAPHERLPQSAEISPFSFLFATVDFALQPSFGKCPVSPDRACRNAKNCRRLLNAQAAEKAQLDHFAFALIYLG